MSLVPSFSIHVFVGSAKSELRAERTAAVRDSLVLRQFMSNLRVVPMTSRGRVKYKRSQDYGVTVSSCSAEKVPLSQVVAFGLVSAAA